MIHVKGEYSTMGFVGHLKYPVADEHAVIAEMLEAAGAVFYCKTNVPQTLFVSSRFVLQKSFIINSDCPFCRSVRVLKCVWANPEPLQALPFARWQQLG